MYIERLYMSKKKVMFMVDEIMNKRLKKVSLNLRVSKSEIVSVLLDKFIPILEDEKEFENIPQILLFDTDSKRFNGVSSLFDENVEDYKKMKRG